MAGFREPTTSLRQDLGDAIFYHISKQFWHYTHLLYDLSSLRKHVNDSKPRYDVTSHTNSAQGCFNSTHEFFTEQPGVSNTHPARWCCHLVVGSLMWNYGKPNMQKSSPKGKQTSLNSFSSFFTTGDTIQPGTVPDSWMCKLKKVQISWGLQTHAHTHTHTHSDTVDVCCSDSGTQGQSSTGSCKR